MIGEVKGKLKLKAVIAKNGRKFAVCNCDCGNEKVTRLEYFCNGGIKCCGCTLWAYHRPILTNETLAVLFSKNPKSFSQYYGTRIHNTWRSVLFTDKGKKSGSPPEWRDFFVFMEDVQNGYSPSLYMQRLDQSAPFSKSNFEWVEKSKIHSRKSKIIIDYMGESFSARELSEKVGVSEAAIKTRLAKGLSIDEVVKPQVRLKPKEIKSHTQMQEKERRAKASKMISSYRHKDMLKGYSTDIDTSFMLNHIFGKPCSYCGTIENVGCDRLDNSKGHTKKNIVPACRDCNTIRNNIFSFEEMVKIGAFIRDEIYEKRKLLEES